MDDLSVVLGFRVGSGHPLNLGGSDRSRFEGAELANGVGGDGPGLAGMKWLAALVSDAEADLVDAHQVAAVPGGAVGPASLPALVMVAHLVGSGREVLAPSSGPLRSEGPVDRSVPVGLAAAVVLLGHSLATVPAGGAGPALLTDPILTPAWVVRCDADQSTALVPGQVPVPAGQQDVDLGVVGQGLPSAGVQCLGRGLVRPAALSVHPANRPDEMAGGAGGAAAVAAALHQVPEHELPGDGQTASIPAALGEQPRLIEPFHEPGQHFQCSSGSGVAEAGLGDDPVGLGLVRSEAVGVDCRHVDAGGGKRRGEVRRSATTLDHLELAAGRDDPVGNDRSHGSAGRVGVPGIDVVCGDDIGGEATRSAWQRLEVVGDVSRVGGQRVDVVVLVVAPVLEPGPLGLAQFGVGPGGLVDSGGGRGGVDAHASQLGSELVAGGSAFFRGESHGGLSSGQVPERGPWALSNNTPGTRGLTRRQA